MLVRGEIRRGIELLRSRDPGRAPAIDRWLATLEADYADRIVPVTAEAADRWGRADVPDPLPVVDGLMAATALAHGWTFVTRNVRHVARSGVRVLDPFGGPGHGSRGGRRGG